MLENYEKLSKLGDGAQGSVYKVRHRVTKKELALKMIRCRDSAAANMALKEVKVLIQLRHPSIVSYTDFFLDFDNRNPKEMLVCLVMELCEEQHLEQLIKSTKKEMMMSGQHPIPEETILVWILQAAHALQYVHEKGFMHRDLKPSNIFFASEGGGGGVGGAAQSTPAYSTTMLGGVVAAAHGASSSPSSSSSYPRRLKLGDFGLATATLPNGDLNKSTVGTPYYFAPEQMLRQKYDNKVDIWGLGAVMLELICLSDRPINSEVLERPEVAEVVVKDICRMGFSKGLAVIIRDMVHRYPAARPTSALVVERVKALLAHQLNNNGGSSANNTINNNAAAAATANTLASRRPSAINTVSGGGGGIGLGASSRVQSAAASRNNSHNNSGVEGDVCSGGNGDFMGRGGVGGGSSVGGDALAVGALEAGRLCEMCQSRASKYLCHECQESHCSDCDLAQHRAPSRRHHKRTEIAVTTPLFLAASGVGYDAQLGVVQQAVVPCQMCEEKAAVVLCPACDSEAYCKQCDELKHINPKRRLHERIVIAPTMGGPHNSGGGGGGKGSAATSRKNSPKIDPLAATLSSGMATLGNGLGVGHNGGATSIVNTTTIIAALATAPPSRAGTAVGGRRNSVSLRGGGGGAAAPSTAFMGDLSLDAEDSGAQYAPQQLGAGGGCGVAAAAAGGPVPHAADQTPVAEPLERHRSAASLAASSIHMASGNTTMTMGAATARGARNNSPPTLDGTVGGNTVCGGDAPPLIATLRNNGTVPTANSLNPYLMPKAVVAKRPAGTGAPIDPSFVDKYLAVSGGARNSASATLSIVVPSPECPTLEEAVAIIAAAQAQRGSVAANGTRPRNDRIVIASDIVVNSPIGINFAVDIIGLVGASSPASTSSTPTIAFNCTPAFTLTSVGGSLPAGSSSTPTSPNSPTPPFVSSPTVAAGGAAGLPSSNTPTTGTLSNLNIRHDSEDIPKAVNRAKVAAVVIDGGHWRVERCRLTSIAGHGLIAEGSDTVARVVECAVISTKLCGLMLLNGTSGEVTQTHIVDAKQTGILVRKGTTTKITRNQIKQNGETGVYVVDARPLIEENDISSNMGCGVVVKGEDAAPTIRENTIASNTQAGIFYCDGARGTSSDNIISDSQRAGILIKTRANPTITRNIVRRSKETGIYCFEGGRGTLTHNTITDNMNAGILVTTSADVAASHNRIHKNYYEALWVCKAGGGTFQNNDLRFNRKGPKDIEEGCAAAMAGNLEA